MEKPKQLFTISLMMLLFTVVSVSARPHCKDIPIPAGYERVGKKVSQKKDCPSGYAFPIKKVGGESQKTPKGKNNKKEEKKE